MNLFIKTQLQHTYQVKTMITKHKDRAMVIKHSFFYAILVQLKSLRCHLGTTLLKTDMLTALSCMKRIVNLQNVM